MRKPTIWVLTGSDTNRPIQSQKKARSLKFVLKKKDCTIRAAKSMVLLSCAVTAQLICGFVFAYVNCWFSHAVAQLLSDLQIILNNLSFLTMSPAKVTFN